MSGPEQHHAESARRTHRRRGIVDLQRELQAGTSGLAANVAGWAAFAPKPSALDEAERAAQGVLRLVGELRGELYGPPDAAA